MKRAIKKEGDAQFRIAAWLRNASIKRALTQQSDGPWRPLLPALSSLANPSQ